MPRLPVVGSAAGAQLGRHSRHATPAVNVSRVRLHREPLDQGGYDSGGAYWGTPDDLWHATTHNETVDWFFRAQDRQTAKRHVLKRYPNAKFYR